MTRIFDTDSAYEIARKIYNDFELGQSCVVKGYFMDADRALSKGEEVIKELESMDKAENLRPMGQKMTRKRTKLPNTIGGYVAHKIFKYERKSIDKQISYTIWRIQ